MLTKIYRNSCCVLRFILMKIMTKVIQLMNFSSITRSLSHLIRYAHPGLHSKLRRGVMQFKKQIAKPPSQLPIIPMSEGDFIPGSLNFTCNICGINCSHLLNKISREEISCHSCGSTLRLRSLIAIFTRRLFGKNMSLDEIPVRRDLLGIGMTDWFVYAEKLAKKLSYTNTFYHCDPKLDIMNPPESMTALLDFVITSDVLEHVVPPVSKAFENIFKILKPGGILFLTVPYTLNDSTVEHFPDLNAFKIIEGPNGFYLENTTLDGRVERFDKLCFHGGPGSTLEMRVLCEKEALKLLKDAGFIDIQIHHEAYFEHGVYQAIPWSLPISAKKPTVIEQALK